ncbi:hybrid sensor histidine kinase/response regulator [Maribellus maritimus]|uniref:hybrid sensor histidine kinase/response regulator n=1 Tax=Maribellus maritimus TaxID=2870838 RepID=UPI001EEAF33E|nr:hybrid sensor histidine kinase/response regulator [Maribellus maritimus]MCG6191256.1 response regulator [Maribellus maritimus]
MKRYFSLHFLISFIVLTSLFAVPLILFYNFKINTHLNELKTREIHNLELQETVIEKTLDEVIDNLLLLKEHVKASGETIDSYQKSITEKNRLENDFKAFSIGKHRLYDQLRLLSANGNEVIRINFSDDSVKIVDKNHLQNKSQRYYFKELSKLNDDDIYISPFDLNVEYEEIEQPIKPMLRIGTPIIDSSGQFSGVVLINYLGQNILSSVNELKPSDYYMILNQNGYWIQNDRDPSTEWGFMYDSLRNQRFQNSFNAEWTAIQNNEKGQFQNKSGLFTYQTVYPVREDSLQYISEEDERETINIVRDQVSFWKLVSYIDNATLQAQTTPVKTERNIILLFFILISAGLAYGATKIRVNEFIAKKNLKDLNNNLEYEVRQRTEEIRKARQKAEENDRLKTAFLNNMSHEIRTPLNAIIGFADLMEKSDYDDKETKKFAHIINKRGNDLLVIVDDILDISKIESGQVSMYEEQCVLYNELFELTELYNVRKLQTDKAHIELQFDCACVSEKEWVKIDIGKLRQVLSNLLNNAFKFTEKGKIELKCIAHENKMLLFSVSDTGIGIPKDKQERVFERFVQSENRLTIETGGTGLGLSIVKGIVDFLGGEVWLESTPDVGSTFYFTMPYKKANQEEEDADLNEKTDDRSLEILVVEDDPINNEYIKTMFNQTNHKLTIAVSGSQALQYENDKFFDIILMDIKLPDINGMEVTKQIRKRNKSIKIIAQTAYASIEDKLEALRSGCNEYISKPLQVNKLMDLIVK